MDAATRQRFHGLKAHLLNGADKPDVPAGIVGNEQIFAADGTTVLKPGEQAMETPQAVNSRRKLASRSASTAVRSRKYTSNPHHNSMARDRIFMRDGL